MRGTAKAAALDLPGTAGHCCPSHGRRQKLRENRGCIDTTAHVFDHLVECSPVMYFQLRGKGHVVPTLRMCRSEQECSRSACAGEATLAECRGDAGSLLALGKSASFGKTNAQFCSLAIGCIQTALCLKYLSKSIFCLRCLITPFPGGMRSSLLFFVSVLSTAGSNHTGMTSTALQVGSRHWLCGMRGPYLGPAADASRVITFQYMFKCSHLFVD